MRFFPFSCFDNCDNNNKKNVRGDSNGPSEINSCNYDDAMELTGHGPYNYLLLAACSVISNAVGVDMFGFGVVVAAATCDLQLGITETAALASAPFAGVLFAFPWGYYADTSGRRRALLLSTSAGFIFGVLSSFSPNWQVMLTFKLIGYCFSAAAFNLVLTYLGECTGNKRRSRYLFIINSAELAAEIVFYFLAYLLLPLDFNISIPWLSISFRPWRLYSIVLAAPLGIGAVLMIGLHESPKFLASKGKTDKALTVLRAMYEANGGVKGTYPVKALADENMEEVTRESFWKSIGNQTWPLFKPPMLWRTLQLCYLMAICCSTNYVFVMWYPSMVNIFVESVTREWGGGASFCQRVITNATIVDSDHMICDDTISPYTIYTGMIVGVVFASLNLIIAAVAKWRRLVLLATLLVAAVSLVLVNLLTDPIADIVVFTLIQCTAIGIGSVASYFVDLYPTAHRALVTSLGLTIGRLFSFGGVNLVGAVIETHCSLTFYCWAVFVCSGIVISLLLPPDTIKK